MFMIRLVSSMSVRLVCSGAARRSLFMQFWKKLFLSLSIFVHSMVRCLPSLVCFCLQRGHVLSVL